MTEILWAPWRMEYILRSREDRCVFCDALAQGEAHFDENFILYAGPRAFVILNRYPYGYANILVVPNRHVARPEALTVEERQAFFELLVVAQSTLQRALNPQGINLGLNLGTAAGAGIKDHMHAHIVPRWNGDANFMPILADVRVMPEHLEDTYRTLKSFFLELD